MVFCYKTAAESPRKAGSGMKGASMRLYDHNSSLSEFVASLNYDDKITPQNILSAIPEHEWRVLQALSKKREQDLERNKLSQDINEMWQREEAERKKLDQEASESYNRYIRWKRAQEQQWQQQKRDEMRYEDQMRTGQLVNYIMQKEQRTANVLADQDDLKTKKKMDKALDHNIRYLLASGRRDEIGAAEAYRREVDLAMVQRRVDEARKRREERLKDAAQRVAVTNAITSWDSLMARQELLAMEATKVAHNAAKIAMTDAKSNKILWAREKRKKRARDIAMITSQLRESVRAGAILF